MKTQDFLLLVFDALGGKAESETRIQKMTFLAKKEHNLDVDVKFRWHNYGPFSDSLKKILSELQKENFIEINTEIRRTFMGDTYRITLFELTGKGKATASSLKKNEAPSRLNEITAIAKQYGTSPLSEILSYVYGAYSPHDV